MIRPELVAALTKAREVIAALGLALVGIWIGTRGGYFLLGVGGAVIAFAAAFGLIALRRLRFAQGNAAPGIVEVDEAEIRFLGPRTGGAVSLADLAELRLITMRGRRAWRLKQTDGQALLIPVDASGADRLFDAFSALPGMNTQSLVAALTPPTIPPGSGHALAPQDDGAVIGPIIWRRPARAVLT